ncbi:hypothetical protein RHSIM_Rhsim05G0048900 [Rhododendron simsii]|uniref:Uncharacterized protein n=1 Tax=Rhododendron simsii TaxID=118357 RepID=A0A834GXI3_RHOSS|nr:hypothetical protein RHSIM_Rhsim05G0048900 [Rhododendron simsii]
MGCTGSKLDDLPAVALCRDRCRFLEEAIRQRYDLAESHLSYLHSLKTVGVSLNRFFDRDLGGYAAVAEPPSPVLNLPAQRKTVDLEEPSGSPHRKAVHFHSHSHSDSGSHLHLHSGSDSDDSADSPLHHHYSGNDSPLHHNHYGQIDYADHGNLGSYQENGYMGNETLGSYQGNGYMGNETLGSYQGNGYMGMGMNYPQNPSSYNTNMNYMRNKATPSVLYEQRPLSAETVRIDESPSSSYYNNYPQNPSSSYPYNGPPSYGGGGRGGGMNGFFGGSNPQYGGGSYPPQYGGGSYPLPPAGSIAGPSEASSSKPPPPPPSPPRSSAWDFLYPFEGFESYYPPYTSSRDSKELREEEGIPDLEDEDYSSQQEVVKEVYGKRQQKFVDGGKSYAKAAVDVEEEDDDRDVVKDGADSVYRNKRPSVVVESDPVEYEVHMVDKKVVDNEERSVDRGNVAGFKAPVELRGDSEVLKEIQVQFERASELGSELGKILEVGKIPYKKHGGYHVSSKMLHVFTPSLPLVSSQPSTSINAEPSSIANADPAYLENDDDVVVRSGNLSSTLQKLFLWEKKLFEEVKGEEKMRVLHERKSRKLKSLDERGAEAHKIDATRTLVRSLSTKIRIAIQIVDKISVKINKLRDEDLLTRVWRSMLECHQSQRQAILQARRLDAVASHKHFSDAHLEATLQLEHELLEWTFRFSCWVGAQKGFVRALNDWLLKCLLYEPEETADGVVPFSPSRIGAPPIFVICNQWSQALGKISEKEVVDSMRDFANSVLQLWERDKQEMRQRMMANKDMEKKVKNLERKDQKIQKGIQALDKRIVLVSGTGGGLSVGHVYQSETSKSSSLQVSLQHIFEAMERFAANILRTYEELLQRIEEDRKERLARENEEVS